MELAKIAFLLRGGTAEGLRAGTCRVTVVVWCVVYGDTHTYIPAATSQYYTHNTTARACVLGLASASAGSPTDNAALLQAALKGARALVGFSRCVRGVAFACRLV